MLTAVYTRQFERDIRRLQRRGKDMEELKAVVRTLLGEEPLGPLHRDHRLVGSYQGRRECHIEPDWLLIYKREANAIVFERSGTHADLFRG
jgi:mRNA interferase YafQ